MCSTGVWATRQPTRWSSAATAACPGWRWRHGQVAVGMANHLGSALAGSLGLLPFLDGCARQLLGEGLRLPSIPAIWCGDAEVRAEVERDIGRFVLHDTAPRKAVGAGARAVFGDRLDGEAEVQWRALLRDAPERVVAQEHVRFASSPVLGAHGLEPGEVTIRLIAIHGPDGVEVLPGGVGRVVDESMPVVAQPRGAARGKVKDVWVVGLPSRPSVRLAARTPLDPVDLRDSLPTSRRRIVDLGRSPPRTGRRDGPAGEGGRGAHG